MTEYKFRKLFWKIWAEHWPLQIIIYLGIFVGLGLSANIVNPYSGAAIACLFIKALGTVSSLVKTTFIYLGCKKHDPKFIEIYHEWMDS